jgi:hypothetical protein
MERKRESKVIIGPRNAPVNGKKLSEENNSLRFDLLHCPAGLDGKALVRSTQENLAVAPLDSLRQKHFS